MLSPEAELNAIAEKLAEPSRAKDPDHLSYREARSLVSKAIRATRILARREHPAVAEHGPGECERAKRAIAYAILDLDRGLGRCVPGNMLEPPAFTLTLDEKVEADTSAEDLAEEFPKTDALFKHTLLNSEIVSFLKEIEVWLLDRQQNAFAADHAEEASRLRLLMETPATHRKFLPE